MATTVKWIIERASVEANDEAFQSIKGLDWFEWINDAQRAVCLLRPDAKSDISTFLLVTGTKQQIPAGTRRLQQLLRNMGTAGSTPGKAIRGPVPREDLDAVNPDWHKSTYHGTEVEQYIYEENNPTFFYVYPGLQSAATLYVEAVVSKDPTDVSDHNSNLDIPDIFAPAVVEWVLYRAWARDSERSPNWVRAERKYRSFFNLLGVNLRAELAVSPKLSERDRQLQAAAMAPAA